MSYVLDFEWLYANLLLLADHLICHPLKCIYIHCLQSQANVCRRLARKYRQLKDNWQVELGMTSLKPHLLDEYLKTCHRYSRGMTGWQYASFAGSISKDKRSETVRGPVLQSSRRKWLWDGSSAEYPWHAKWTIVCWGSSESALALVNFWMIVVSIDSLKKRFGPGTESCYLDAWIGRMFNRPLPAHHTLGLPLPTWKAFGDYMWHVSSLQLMSSIQMITGTPF